MKVDALFDDVQKLMRLSRLVLKKSLGPFPCRLDGRLQPGKIQQINRLACWSDSRAICFVTLSCF
jgi:hypothetical protein